MSGSINIFIAVLLMLNMQAMAKDEPFKDTLVGKFSDGCHLLSRGLSEEVPKNLGLQFFIKDVMSDLKGSSMARFSRHFHPRARVAKDIGERVLSILEHRYDKPWQFSIFGVWGFIDQDKKKELYECERADNVRLISHNGYEKQYMLIVQVMSNNELGRLIFSIAPKPDKTLSIIGFHIQQWTHKGDDWVKWTTKGNEAIKNNDMKSAYIYFDIAQKLLEGGSFVSYNLRKDILSERDKIFSQEDLVKALQEDTKNKDIVYVGTIMSRTDTGILVRVEIDKEYNAEDLQGKCRTIGKSLVKGKWLSGVNGGLNCNFIPKGSDPNTNSKVGGYYIPRGDI